MQGKNEFFSGLNTDVDVLKIKNTCIRDSINMRSVDVDGHGLVKVNLKGNTFHFAISTGFVPIGKIETNFGFAVIFSYNSVTKEGEIGTFPSPAPLGGFINVYAPLKNFNGNNPLRSTEFNFSLANPIRDGYVRIDSDQSFNIYYTDNNNPYRVTNTGFDKSGTYNSRGYTTSSLKKMIRLFLNTPVHPSISLQGISIGGAHKAGTYVYYIRYCTSTYDYTPFIVHSGPVNISPDIDFDPLKNTAKGQVEGYVTNKAVRLQLDGMDTDFPLFQIARIYYYGDNMREVQLLDKYYDVAASTSVYITDQENKNTLTLSEILYKHPYHDTGKAMKSFQKRAWYGNLQESNEINDTYLAEFAKRIIITYDVLDLPVDAANPETPLLGYGDIYKNFQLKYDFVGYFRGETYCFATEFVTTRGTTTEGYPMQGMDEWNQDVAASGVYQNVNGIYRFPCQYEEQLIGVLKLYGVKNAWSHAGTFNTDNVRILGVKFDLTAAKAWLEANAQAYQYFNDNIATMYFNRAERKPNMIYEGLMVGAYSLDFEDKEAFMKISRSNVDPDSIMSTVTNFPATRYPNWPLNGYSGNIGEIVSGDPVDAINPLNLPKRDQDIFIGNDLFFFDFNYKRVNWRKFPMYARGGALNDGPNFPALELNHPRNFAAMPFTAEWKKTWSGEDKTRKAFIEIYPGLHNSYLLNPPSNAGYPQVMPWCFRGLFSIDYLFKKNFSDGDYPFILWSRASFSDYPDLSGTSGLPYVLNPGDDDQSRPNIRPYTTGSLLSGITNLRDPGGISGNYVRFGGSAYGIKGWQTADKKSFVGMFLEGLTDSADGLFYLYAEIGTGGFHRLYNRAMAFNDYLGLSLNVFNGALRGNSPSSPIDGSPLWSGNDSDLLNYMTSVYRKDPIPSIESTADWGGYDIRDLYDPVKMDFFRISYPVKLVYADGPPKTVSFQYPTGTSFEWESVFSIADSDGNTDILFDFADLTNNTVTCFRGDCYMGKWTMKTIFNPDGVGILPDAEGSDPSSDEDHSYEEDPNNAGEPLTWYGNVKAGFGHTIAFFQQSDLNIAMRTQLQDAKEQFWNWKTDQNGDFDFQEHSVQNVYRECIELNKGYNRSLGDLVCLGYDASLPYRNKKYPVRIMYSDPQVDGQFEDYYRKVFLASNQDYDQTLGEINGLFVWNNDLIAVQQYGIVQLSTQERAQVETSSGKLTIGEGIVLSPKAIPINTKLGSQHQFSLIETATGIYGWDVDKRRGWKLGSQGFDTLTISKSIHTLIDKYFLQLNVTTDNSFELTDNPYNGFGINCGYNRKYNEVIFNFNFPKNLNIRPPLTFTEELVFNELTDCFDYRGLVKSPMYININSDLIAVNPAAFKDFYLQDNNPLHCNFFGIQFKNTLRFIVNGDSEGLADEKKLYEFLELVSNSIALNKVTYRNLMQTATHSPFTGLSFAEAYAEPEYKENKWYIPIKRADAVAGSVNNIFQTESVMRDKHLDIELEWLNTSEVFIKSAITNFIISVR